MNCPLAFLHLKENILSEPSFWIDYTLALASGVPRCWLCYSDKQTVQIYIFAGYFSQISTLADVQENVMRYLHVMSRPKVIDHEHDTVWTEAYVDSAVSIDCFKVQPWGCLFRSGYRSLCSVLTLLLYIKWMHVCLPSPGYSPHAAGEISHGTMMYIRVHTVNAEHEGFNPLNVFMSPLLFKLSQAHKVNIYTQSNAAVASGRLDFYHAYYKRTTIRRKIVLIWEKPKRKANGDLLWKGSEEWIFSMRGRSAGWTFIVIRYSQEMMREHTVKHTHTGGGGDCPLECVVYLYLCLRHTIHHSVDHCILSPKAHNKPDIGEGERERERRVVGGGGGWTWGQLL